MIVVANGFEAFDLRSWVVDGLATHLPARRTKINKKKRIWPASAGRLKLLIPAAAAIAGMTVFASAYQAASTGATTVGQAQGVRNLADQPLGPGYMSGTARFAQEAAQVIAALSKGVAPAAPQETLRLAQLAVERLTVSTPEGVTWITTLADQLSKLDD